MARLTITDAEQIAGRNRPWTFRLEFIGPNAANHNGSSRKYWYATGRGLHESVEIGWGALGSVPQHQLIDWPELRLRVAAKLVKGYDYADTLYVRMSAGSMATLTGTASVVVPAPMPALPSSGLTVVTPLPPMNAVPTHVHPALVAMGEPYSLVASLRIQRQGIKVQGYTALDKDGDALFELTARAGIDFAQKYDVDVLWV